jgi:hypothetical protein
VAIHQSRTSTVLGEWREVRQVFGSTADNFGLIRSLLRSQLDSLSNRLVNHYEMVDRDLTGKRRIEGLQTICTYGDWELPLYIECECVFEILSLRARAYTVFCKSVGVVPYDISGSM